MNDKWQQSDLQNIGVMLIKHIFAHSLIIGTFTTDPVIGSQPYKLQWI